MWGQEGYAMVRGDGFAYKRGTSNRKGTGDGRNRTYETENSVGFVEK